MFMATTHIKLKSLLPESLHTVKVGDTSNMPEDNKDEYQPPIGEDTILQTPEAKKKRLHSLKRLRELQKGQSWLNYEPPSS